MNLKESITRYIFNKFSSEGSESSRDGVYTIGKYSLLIPPRYLLPKYQKEFKLYDRFLPVLSQHISSNQIIIDVGANIGDTLISMIQHCENQFFCFEPSNHFLKYLTHNVNSLDEKDKARVKIFTHLVGTGTLTGNLSHHDSTSSLTIDDGSSSIKPEKLDNFVQDTGNVILVKVDTDGFDYDVLASAAQIISNSKPILFWENEIKEDYQLAGFQNLYNLLETNGYKYFCVFDNFGNIMFEGTHMAVLDSLNQYLYSMNKTNCTRTIYYTDVLATTERHENLAKKAIEEYKEKWIKI